MTAYWVAHVQVTDPESYGRYAELATAAIESFGGEFLARGTRTLWLEGNERTRNVIVRFPSLEVAESCYQSEAYQEALQHARGASVRDVCVIEANN